MGKIDPANVGKLEALLPPRDTVEVPSTAEECMLMDVDPNQMPGKGRGGSSSHNGNVYDEDDDERHGHGPQGVQCQTQQRHTPNDYESEKPLSNSPFVKKNTLKIQSCKIARKTKGERGRGGNVVAVRERRNIIRLELRSE